MHPDDLKRLLQRQPFKPFRLTLTNNDTHEIRHPEFALLSHRLLEISLPDSGDNFHGEDQVGVDVFHVVKYEFLPPSPPSPPAPAAS